MNNFSHAHRFLDEDPYFVVGTLLPDWLTLVDRKVRVREKSAMQFVDNGDGLTRQLARGIVQHHRDDDWFHGLPVFVEMNLAFAVELRELLGGDAGFRPHLAGHIVIEMLLDAKLIEENREKLDLLYSIVKKTDPVAVQRRINRIASKSTCRISQFMPRFISEAYLYDYLENRLVRYRLNRVLNRVKLMPLPAEFLDWLPSARQRVYMNADQMLVPRRSRNW